MKGKKRGIQKKLMVSILPIVAISFLVLIFVAYNVAKTSIQEKTQNLLEAEGKAGVNSILAWEAENLGILDTAVDTMLNLKQNDDEILNYGKFFLETYEAFPYGIYIGYENGKVLDASGWEPDYDITQSTWFLEGQSNTSFVFGEPYLDSMTGAYIVTASRGIDNLNGKKAVAAADVNLSILTEVVSQMDIVASGDAYIMDANTKMILAHKDSSLLASNVEEMSDPFYKSVNEKVASGALQTASIDSSEGSYMTSINNIEGTSWYIVTRALETNIYSDLSMLAGALIGVGVFVMIAIVAVLVILIGKITKPLALLTDNMVMVTDGDFTTDVTVTGNDEVTTMAQSMKDFLEVMRKTLRMLINISIRIDEQAKESYNISGELYESANGQEEAMRQMRDNLEELVQSIGVIAENATKLALVVSNTNAAGKDAIENIKETMSEADIGRNSMQVVTDSMAKMKSDMDELEHAISNVGEAAVKIDEITATIRGIAEETNLLALNASIEAARAGEAGKGFAVVATEIKKLAETSADAAGEISDLINSVTGLISTTVEMSHNSMEQIYTSTDLVYQASEQFQHIYGSIENTNEIIDGMIGKIHEANDVATNMAAITEEQSASAEEIEAAAINIQELANTVTKNSAIVKDEATELTTTADSLKTEIIKFKI